MHELGELEAKAHLDIGKLAHELGVDHLVSIGTDLYFNGLNLTEDSSMSVHYMLTQEQALSLAAQASEGDVFLVKASRAEHLDELAEKLLANWQVEA
jgi:UDP-N-acetylmuramoyl-tripeptide--D-alanyl-D-alanine ligase